MDEELLNVIMCDGSRQFGELPQTVPWHELRTHIEKLDGALVSSFLIDKVIEAWIDFPIAAIVFQSTISLATTGSLLILQIARISFSN